MATVVPLVFDTTAGFPGPKRMSTSDDIQLGGLEILSTGDITFNGGKILGLSTATPTADSDGVSWAVLKAVANGLPPKASCRLAAAAALNWTASGSGVGKTLTSTTFAASNNDFDGVTSIVGDRILVSKENGTSADVDNGIYEVTQLANGTDAPTILTRTTDFDVTAEVKGGASTWVNEGSTLADTRWTVTTNDPITVDTTPILFSQTAGPGLFTEGDGIAISGNTISVSLATDPGLEFATGDLRVLAYNGIVRDSNGISVDPGAGITVDGDGVNINAGDGLTAALGGDVDVDLSATPGLEFDTGQLQVKVDPAGAISRLAAGLHVVTDDTTIQINGSNQLEVLNASSANALKDELTAGEALALGDAVSWTPSTNDRIRECQASVGARVDAIGVVEEAGGISSEGTGTVVRRGPCTCLTGATAGDRYFVGRTGGLVVGTSSFLAGDHIVHIGAAINATILDVNPYYVTQI